MELARQEIFPATFPIMNAENMLADFTAYVDASKRTIETYAKGIRAFMGYVRDNEIISPAREHVLEWRDSLQTTCKATTVKTYLAGVRRFFSWAAMRGLWEDICQGIKGVKIDGGFKKDCLTTSQIRELLDSIDRSDIQGKRDYAMLTLMVTTGLRDIEVSRACIEDIRTVGDCKVLFIQGKGRAEKAEYVKLSPPVEKAVRQWLVSRGKTEKIAPLFCSISNHGYGSALTTRSISRIVKERLRSIGIDSDRITAHSLRHSAATLNLLSGGTLEETQQLLRHSSIVTTMIYSHALERMNNNSENRISEKIFG